MSNSDSNKIPKELLDKVELEKTGMISGERPVDIIRRMNPGKFIPTGEELSKMLREADKNKADESKESEIGA